VYVDFMIAEHELFEYFQVRTPQLDDEIHPDRFAEMTRKQTDPLLSRIMSGLAELKLIAPENVYRTAGNLWAEIESIREEIGDAPFSDADVRSISVKIVDSSSLRRHLADLMREDVTPEDSKTDDWKLKQK
jgi:hypothetical protein